MTIDFNAFGAVATTIFTIISLAIKLLVCVLCVFKLEKALLSDKTPQKKKALLISIVSIFIVLISGIFNIGWIRFALLVSFVPFTHALAFVTMNLYSAKYAQHSNKIKIYNLLFIATYMVASILLPDGGDIGEMYFCFGLIHSDSLADKAVLASGILFTAHAILLIMQLLEIRRINKSIKQKEGIQQ